MNQPASKTTEAQKARRVRMLKSEPPDPELPTREDVPYVSGRLMFILVAFCLMTALFVSRIYKLTILDGPELRHSADNNFLKEEPLLAPRGRILDRNGQPLAINQLLYDVQMSPFHMKNEEIKASVEKAASLLNMPQAVKKAEKVAKLYPRWNSISLLDHGPIELSEVLPLREQSFDLPGVMIVPQYQRCYPEESVAGLITGYVGSINKNLMDRFLTLGYFPSEKIGRLGAERTFESLLHGEHGMQLVERDAQGRPRSQPYTSHPAKPGNIMTLTIDLGLQRLADALLEGWNGAIIAMDPRDGSVLAMAARPHYDPNDPLGRHAPPGTFSTFNKITRSKFAPGSTFKVITASAGLAADYPPTQTFDCDGAWTPPGFGVRFPCHFKWGHGSQNLYEALKNSCNVFFYHWAYNLGAGRMIDMASAFGFGQRTDFELVTADEESPGKLAQIGGEKIFKGSVLQMGIGQGAMIDVTPIQMARAYAALINGGTLYRPRILKEVSSPEGKPLNEIKTADGKVVQVGQPEAQGTLPLTDQQRGEILEGLWRVVNEEGGTGSHSGIKAEWKVSGKSGTAQHGIKGIPPNAWFTCFAPSGPGETPQILLVILVEHAGHGGTVAAPLARQMLAYYFGQPEPLIVPPPKGEYKPPANSD